jgi:hypothetical protein
MKLTRRWAGRLALALVLAALLSFGAFVLIGASAEEETLTPGDAVQMRQLVNKYWAAVQHSWPESLQKSKQKKLPDAMKAAMKAERRAVAAKVTTGRLAKWEDDFEPGGFLEEMRASGTVVTGNGYEVLSMTEPVLVSEDLAQADVVIRDWSEQYEEDSQTNPLGDPYRTENVSTYSYTFQKIDGSWRIAIQDLLSNSL